MDKMKKQSILKEIDSSKGYDVALFTTFNFEIDYFEQRIFPLLLKNKIRTVDIFVDAKQLNDSLKDAQSSIIGRKYHVTPIKMLSSFHPKAILLIGEKKAKIFVSSANVKTSGYEQNNEVFSSFEIEENDFSQSSILRDTIEFFISLYNYSDLRDSTIYDYLRKNKIDSSEDNDKTIINTLNGSIVEQVKDHIGDKVVQIDIAVPFYDDHLEAYKKIKEVFNCSEINLYIQNQKNSFPVILNKQENVIDFKRIKVFDRVENNKNSNFYHGKLFRLKTKENDYVLFGSSNCTNSALTKSFVEGGNIEFNVLQKGEPNEYDYYFDNFSVTDDTPLTSGLYNYSAQDDDSSFTFYYGKKENEEISLVFVYHGKPNVTDVKFEETSLKHEFIDKYLVVKINEDLLIGSFAVFDLSIYHDGKTNTITCWYVNDNYLRQFRLDSEDIKYVDYKFNDGLDKYIQHVQSINNAILENIEIIDIVHTDDVSDDYGEEGLEEEALTDGNFMLYDEVKDSYPVETTLGLVLGKANVLSQRYFSSVFHNDKKEGNSSFKYEKHNNTGKTREASSQEKRFGRYLKRIIKEYVIGKKSENFSYTSYKKIVGTVLDPIEQYFYVEKVPDFLDRDFVVSSKIRIAEIFLTKMVSQKESEQTKEDLGFIIKAIIETYVLYQNDLDIIGKLKKMMYILDKNYGIKSKLKSLLEEIDLSDIDEKMDASAFFAPLDNLLGYKDENQLKNYLIQVYGGDVDIQHYEKRTEITITTDKYQFSLAKKHIVEISKYLDGNRIKNGRVHIHFIVLNDSDVLYDIELAKNQHINCVYQTGKMGKRQCRLVNDIYMVSPMFN